MNRLQVQIFIDNLIWVIVLVLLINAFLPRNLQPMIISLIFLSQRYQSMLVFRTGYDHRAPGSFHRITLALPDCHALAPRVPAADPVTCIFNLAVGALVGFFNGFCIAKIGVNPFCSPFSMLIMLRGLVLFLVPFSIFPRTKFTYTPDRPG